MRHILVSLAVLVLGGLTVFAQGPELPNTHTSSEPINEDGTGIVTFNYPEDWIVIEEPFLGITITNDEDMFDAAEITEGQIAVIVMPVPELNLFFYELESIAEDETLEDYADRAATELEATMDDVTNRETTTLTVNDRDVVRITIETGEGNIDLYFFNEERPSGVLAIAVAETLEAERETVEAIIGTFAVDFAAMPIGSDIARLVDASSEGPPLEAGQTETITVEGEDVRAMALTLEGEEGDVVVVEVEEVGEGKQPSFTLISPLNTLVQTVDGTQDDQERKIAFGAATIDASGVYTLLVYPTQNEQPWAEAVEGTLAVTYWVAEPLQIDEELEIDAGERLLFVSETMVAADADIDVTLIPLEESEQYLVIVENKGDEPVSFSLSAEE